MNHYSPPLSLIAVAALHTPHVEEEDLLLYASDDWTVSESVPDSYDGNSTASGESMGGSHGDLTVSEESIAGGSQNGWIISESVTVSRDGDLTPSGESAAGLHNS